MLESGAEAIADFSFALGLKVSSWAHTLINATNGRAATTTTVMRRIALSPRFEQRSLYGVLTAGRTYLAVTGHRAHIGAAPQPPPKALTSSTEAVILLVERSSAT